MGRTGECAPPSRRLLGDHYLTRVALIMTSVVSGFSPVNNCMRTVGVPLFW